MTAAAAAWRRRTAAKKNGESETISGGETSKAKRIVAACAKEGIKRRRNGGGKYAAAAIGMASAKKKIIGGEISMALRLNERRRQAANKQSSNVRRINQHGHRQKAAAMAAATWHHLDRSITHVCAHKRRKQRARAGIMKARASCMRHAASGAASSRHHGISEMASWPQNNQNAAARITLVMGVIMARLACANGIALRARRRA